MEEKEISGGTEITEKDLASLLSSFISKDKKANTLQSDKIIISLKSKEKVI